MGRLEDEEDQERKGFRVGLDLRLGAMRSLSEREREREREREHSHKRVQRKKRKGMHEICMNM